MNRIKWCIVFLLAFLVFPGGQVNAVDAVKSDSLKPGMASPAFRYRDVNGKVVTLKDFRGKYVYIDIWATWCGPCCAEIPRLKELEKKMRGKKIVFISISCDDERRVWMDYVKKNQMGGVQLHPERDRSFLEAYAVDAIPRFILLDKKGRIVDANCTRPSDPQTLKKLSALKGI